MGKKFEEQESLQVIREMIAQAKYKPRTIDSLYTLLWGYLVFFAALLHWALLSGGLDRHAPKAWLLMLVGGGISLWMSSRQARERRVKTYIDQLIGELWLAFSVVMLSLFFALGSVHTAFLPLAMLLFGLTMWMQGALIKYPVYKAGAAACWICGTLAFSLNNEQQLLALGAAVLLGHIVPGHILFVKTRSDDVR